MEPQERIILALDGFTTIGEALTAVRAIGIPGIIVKMNDLLDEYGASAVGVFKEKGYRVFADMKVHDIPDTAARRTARWRNAGADFLTVHASGHDEMMKRCVAEAGDKMKILAVTVLTSFDHTVAMHVFGSAPQYMVTELAASARVAGVAGLIISPQELRALRGYAFASNWSPQPLMVTPGVRPAWAAKNDQKRTATPAKAIRDGADHLVIGRPIWKPPPEIGSPKEAFARIVDEIRGALPQGQS